MKNTMIGLVVGIILAGIIGWVTMPGMMLHETLSPYSVDETVAKISAKAKADGWVVAGVKSLNKAVKKHGGYDIPPVMLINLCQADHAYNILKEDANKILSVMMPCTVSVYQKGDGKTYVGSMNAALLGTMFGGTIAEIMGKHVAEQQAAFVVAGTE
ncbi:MAG: DUF302 domain-containing protein [Gammaproteobacteria bacterium]|nr:DUF302 domain-containing protein [Gammaproteobacteria bacterium]